MDEAVRLGLQHRLWSNAAHNLWIRAGVRPGHKVLDLGCGPGHAALDLAQIVGPKGRVVGIDESAVFLKQLAEQAKGRLLTNIDRVLGDVQHLDTALPGPGHDGMFDYAYARWVFCFLARPEEVVRGLARVLKPGGKLMVHDYFNYESMTLGPKRAEFGTVIAAIGRSWREHGGDPDVMGRLPGMLMKAGYRIEHFDVCQRVARPGDGMWHWPDTFWASYLPRLEEMKFITREQRAAFEGAWAEAAADPAAFVLLPPVFEMIAVRE